MLTNDPISSLPCVIHAQQINCPLQGSLNLLPTRKDVNPALYYEPYRVFTFTNTHF